jgi:hypothetical protein
VESVVNDATYGLDPDLETHPMGIEIDWDQVMDDWRESFEDRSVYPMAHSLDYTRDDDKEYLEVFVYVQPGTSREEATDYATEALKGLNDCVYMQDFSFEKSSVDSYGSFVSIYSTHVVVAPYDTKDDESTWLGEAMIPPMEYYPVGAFAKVAIAGGTVSAVDGTEAGSEGAEDAEDAED